MVDNRITVAFPVNYLSIGGAEQQLLELVKGIDKARFKPLLVSLYPDGPLEAEAKRIPEAEVLSLNRKGKYDFSILFDFFNLLRRRQVDIVQPFLTPATFFGLLPAIINRTPVKIVTERCGVRKSVNLGNATYRTVEDFLSRFADWVIPNSESGRQYLLRRGIKSSKIRVIYNGINLERLNQDKFKVASIRNQMGLTDERKLVGIVARLDYAKDHSTFLKAAALVSRAIPQTKFAILGDGPLKSSLENEAKQLGLSSSVTFFGSQRDVGTYMSAFDLSCLCSSDEEGCSNVVLESMALGKPVVATDIGGNKEIVLPNENGLLIPIRSPQALADAILLCLTKPERAREMGMRGREMVLKHFTVNNMVANYQILYEEAIERRVSRKR